jgi:hypothetical protein
VHLKFIGCLWLEIKYGIYIPDPSFLISAYYRLTILLPGEKSAHLKLLYPLNCKRYWSS